MNCPLCLAGSGSGGNLLSAGDEGAIGVVVRQLARAVKDRQGAVEVALDANGRLDVVTAVAVRGDLQGQSIERDAVVAADDPLVVLAENLLDLFELGGDEACSLAGSMNS
jgi:hypothetical protein